MTWGRFLRERFGEGWVLSEPAAIIRGTHSSTGQRITREEFGVAQEAYRQQYGEEPFPTSKRLF